MPLPEKSKAKMIEHSLPHEFLLAMAVAMGVQGQKNRYNRTNQLVSR